MKKFVNKIHQVLFWVIPFGVYYAYYKIERLRDGVVVSLGLGAINAIPVIVQMILDPYMVHEGTASITGGMIILLMPLTSLVQVLLLLRWTAQWNESCQ